MTIPESGAFFVTLRRKKKAKQNKKFWLTPMGYPFCS